jgi:hypothetical protein
MKSRLQLPVSEAVPRHCCGARRYGACGASQAECHIMQVGPMGAGRRIQFREVRVLGLRASTSPVLVPAEPGVIGETDSVQMYMHSSIQDTGEFCCRRKRGSAIWNRQGWHG